MIGKVEEPQPHPVKDQLSGIDYRINSPPYEATILGRQHYFVMVGTIVFILTILVPQMGGGNISKFPTAEFLSP
ncbi:putative nucleobase-ascorbate transporter 10 [Acorus gramineus]|uniref:Nucleobase-ascorbate transporter 10 n=1 Tax=Acorus gramineus TaxID=55184 RepID=A0AAV9B912_ACOGR|nr:putative nucleobase-ascorbate transporter 10 [Acorus gramineus]